MFICCWYFLSPLPFYLLCLFYCWVANIFFTDIILTLYIMGIVYTIIFIIIKIHITKLQFCHKWNHSVQVRILSCYLLFFHHTVYYKYFSLSSCISDPFHRLHSAWVYGFVFFFKPSFAVPLVDFFSLC